MLRSSEHVTGVWRYERIEGASHWMQLDDLDHINELLLEFPAQSGAQILAQRPRAVG